MAQAFKCDLCGTLYEKEERSVSIPLGKTARGKAMTVFNVGAGINLCKLCATTDLMNVVKNRNVDGFVEDASEWAREHGWKEPE